MTFDDDMVALQFEHGRILQPCRALGLDWPPPERLDVMGFDMKQTRRSQLTDEQREKMTHVVRCAEYKPSDASQGDAI